MGPRDGDEPERLQTPQSESSGDFDYKIQFSFLLRQYLIVQPSLALKCGLSASVSQMLGSQAYATLPSWIQISDDKTNYHIPFSSYIVNKVQMY